MTRGKDPVTRGIRRLANAAAPVLLALLAVIAPAASQTGPMQDPAIATPSDRVVSNVVIRAGPSVGSAAIGRLAPGDRLPVVEVRPGWVGVRLPDGRTDGSAGDGRPSSPRSPKRPQPRRSRSRRSTWAPGWPSW